jgi:hypothetical protein
MRHNDGLATKSKIGWEKFVARVKGLAHQMDIFWRSTKLNLYFLYMQKWFLNFEPAFSACFFKISDFLEASRKLIFDVLHKKTAKNCKTISALTRKYCFEF